MLAGLKNARIGAKQTILFGAVIACSLASFTAIFIQRSSVEKTVEWSEHTHKVLAETRAVMAAMVDQETGLRGYLVTADEANLAPFVSGQADFTRHLDAAIDLTSDNPEQQQRLAAIEAAAWKWRTDVAEEAIRLVAQPDGLEQARDLERSGAGKQFFDEIRSQVADVVAAEDALLGQRSEDVQGALSAITYAIALGALAMIAVAVFAGMLMTRLVSRPINSITKAMENLAAGKLETAVDMTDRRDEVGMIARAVQVFKDNLIAARALRDAQAMEQAQKEERQRVMEESIRAFDLNIGRVVQSVSSASGQLQTAATALARSAGHTQHQSTVVASASGQTTTNVQGVAAASEELAATVSEIGRQVQESSNIAGQAVEEAARTNDSIAQLSQAADRIGDVVGFISTIAAQTNLLALNATIEAARAGDAGKGFAVVAQEVKALAEQTGKATSEIAAQISGMQTSTGAAVTAIHQISETIRKMSEISGSIAAAVEEQAATTQEISRNVAQAAVGTGEVNNSIVEVSRAATETGSASSQVLASAQTLNGESQQLREHVDAFLKTVRAA